MAEGGAKWFQYGCLGCLGIVALVVVGVAVLLGVAWVGVRSEQVEERVLTPEIAATAVEGGGGGRVRLYVREAELRLDSAGPGEALRVEARYDTNSFTLEESLEPGAKDEPWTYELTFERAGRSGLVSGLRSMMGGTGASLRVFLPPDVPVELDFDMKQGVAAVSLGGLWLTSADIDFEMGALELSFADPLREPMQQLTIHTAMGGSSLSRLGNASPRRLDVRFRMGGMDLDLRGRWLTDSDISINGSMGGGAVRLPRDVVIEGLDRGRIESPEETELPLPTLTFSASSAMGDLEFY